MKRMTRVFMVDGNAIPVKKYGEKKTLRDMLKEAALPLIKRNSEISIDLVVVGNMAAPQFTQQNHLGAFLTTELALDGVPSLRVEAASAAGGTSLYFAYRAIKSRLHRAILVVGVEKMSSTVTEEATSFMAAAADWEYEVQHGITFPGFNGILAQRYCYEFGVNPDDLLLFSVNAHKNAAKNPLAMFQKEISLEKAIKSPLVADPLRLYDCSPVSDGAAAVLLCDEETLKKTEVNRDNVVELVSSEIATDTITLHNREDPLELKAATVAAKRALKHAKITKDDINVWELHDAFSIMAVASLEALGLSEPGKAVDLAKEGEIAIDGKYPISTMGGLKARGHPVGATGIYQAYEAWLQLVQQATPQVDDPQYALTENIGGSGATVTINIFKKM